MDNLWKKESNRAEAQYIDLFACYRGHGVDNFTTEFQSMSIEQRQKDDRQSTIYRQQGNNFFRLKDWPSAIGCYNESLRHAKIGSENEAIAYSNRSACFLQMEKYEEALMDIDLARKANLPQHLIPKLENRRHECKTLLAAVQKPFKRDFKLSYEADKNYPCMADVLEIQHNEEFGRHLVAKCDIPVGQIVMIEKDYIGRRANEAVLCCTCFRKNTSFIACPKCPDAMFCNSDCMSQNIFHKYECGSALAQSYNKLKFYVHSILMAIESFPNIESLMEFVESALAEGPDKLPSSIHDLKSKYHFFFKLKTSPNANKDDSLNYNIYEGIMSILEIWTLFDSEKKQRFLMHLISHHRNIISINAIQEKNHSKSVYTVFSIINHSCAPNLYAYSIGDQNICETIRFVKKGDQLCMNYMGVTDTVAKEERQMELKTRWDFVCKCEKCEIGDMAIDVNLTFDHCYTFLCQNIMDKTKYSEMLERCRQFLNTNGRLAWSRQIQLVSNYFASFTTELYINPIK